MLRVSLRKTDVTKNYNANLWPGRKWHAQPTPQAIGTSGRHFASAQQSVEIFRCAAAICTWLQERSAALSSYAFRLDLHERFFQNARVAQAEQLHYWKGKRMNAGRREFMARAKLA
jgi:hypothetical protein